MDDTKSPISQCGCDKYDYIIAACCGGVKAICRIDELKFIEE